MSVTVPEGYKQTKVGVIPEEWEALPAKNYFDKSIEKGYKGLEIYSVTLNKSWQKRSELDREIGSDVDIEKSLLVREGYLVYNTMRMWQGALGLAENTGVVSPAYIVLKPKAMIDSKFAFYQLKSYRYLHYLKSYSYGLTNDRLRLYFNDFGMIPFVCPPLKEQQKIAQILTTWDKAIEKLEALITTKEQLKKGLMQKLLRGEVRFDGFDGEWEFTKLGNLLEYEQPTPYLVANKDYDDSYETPVLTAGKTFILGYTKEENGIFKEELPVIIFDDFTTATKFVDFPFKAKSSAMKILKAKDDTVNIKLVYEMMQMIDYESSDHKRYWISEYQEIELKFPSQKEQQQIAQVLTTAGKEIELLKEELEALKEQKRGLMQRLLTGEVRVKIED